MPVGSVVLCLAIAALAFGESRSRAADEWRWTALGTLGGLTVALLIRGGVVTEPVFGSPLVFDLVLLLLAIPLVVDLLGLPLPVARRLHLGLHSREWEFHRRLYALTEEARRAADRQGRSGGRTSRDLPQIINRMRVLRAPNQDWADLRDAWASMWERYYASKDEPVEASTREEYLALNETLIERTNVLSARYRDDAARIRSGG